MTKKRDKKLEAEMSAAMILNMAKNVVNDETRMSPARRQARALTHEKMFAERIVSDDKEKRKLKKQVKDLQKALAKACDWALDSADVIEDDGIGVDEEESADFRDVILGLRKLSGEPEEERHAERRKAREEKMKAEEEAEAARLEQRKAKEVEKTPEATETPPPETPTLPSNHEVSDLDYEDDAP